MHVSSTSSLSESFEAELKVSGRSGVHSENLAHRKALELQALELLTFLRGSELYCVVVRVSVFGAEFGLGAHYNVLLYDSSRK